MKHGFILDENILYCGIRGVDKRDNPDNSSARFLTLLAKNCHQIVLEKELNKRYVFHLNRLLTQQHVFPIPNFAYFTNLLFHNSKKMSRDFSIVPKLDDESQIPPKDKHIVRAAKFFNVKIITLDEDLLAAIKERKDLKLSAYEPKDALKFVRQT